MMSMSVVTLEPDDVLKPIGAYRDDVDVVCPDCGAVTVVPRETDAAQCDDCGERLDIESPFRD